jgi:hypothetical protein
MSTLAETRRAQLISAEQLREQQEMSGREGLASLLAAVRRVMNWLLSPFRLAARVLFNSKEVAGVSPAADQDGPANRAVVPAVDDVTLNASALQSVGKGDDAQVGMLMKQIAENPDGGLDVELTGKAEDLDAVLPILLRHIDQILKTHLPSNAHEAQVAAHLATLAETAECSRYAHRLVSREVDSAMKAVVNDPKYLGLSAQSIEYMVRAAAQSPDEAEVFGEGSAEQRLMNRLAVREKIEADFSLQMRQMAVALAPMIGTARSADEMDGRGKELLVCALQAAEAARHKLRVRHAAHGAAKVLPETLAEVADAVSEAIGQVSSAASEKLAADSAVTEAVEQAGEAPVLAPAAAPAPAPAPAETAVGNAAPVVAAAPVLAKSAAPVNAAAVAVKSVVAAGMFGGATAAHRTAEEIDAVNVVDSAFEDEEEGETLVGG